MLAATSRRHIQAMRIVLRALYTRSRYRFDKAKCAKYNHRYIFVRIWLLSEKYNVWVKHCHTKKLVTYTRTTFYSICDQYVEKLIRFCCRCRYDFVGVACLHVINVNTNQIYLDLIYWKVRHIRFHNAKTALKGPVLYLFYFFLCLFFQ